MGLLLLILPIIFIKELLKAFGYSDNSKKR